MRGSDWMKRAKLMSSLVGWCCRLIFLMFKEKNAHLIVQMVSFVSGHWGIGRLCDIWGFGNAHQNYVSCYNFTEKFAHLIVQMVITVKALRDQPADDVTFGASAWMKRAKQMSRLVGWCCRAFSLVRQAWDDAHQNYVCCCVFNEKTAHVIVQMVTFVRRVCTKWMHWRISRQCDIWGLGTSETAQAKKKLGVDDAAMCSVMLVNHRRCPSEYFSCYIIEEKDSL